MRQHGACRFSKRGVTYFEEKMVETLVQMLRSRLMAIADDAVLIIDASARIRYSNAAMDSLSGYPRGDLLNQQLESLLPKAVAPRHGGYIKTYVESARASSVLGQRRQFAIRQRDGNMVPVMLRAFDLGEAEGERYFGAFLTDQRFQRAIDESNAAKWAELQQSARSDPLTGLPNRRAFEAEARRAMARARRSTSDLVIGIADLDCFKHVNDSYGHPAGDTVLQAVAGILNREARANDIVGRIGGEEFSLLFSNTSLEQARVVAERIRCAVAEANIVIGEVQLKITISIGLSLLSSSAKWESAFVHADAALYQAKKDGRNRTVVWGGEVLGATTATAMCRQENRTSSRCGPDVDV